jgi:hypothetical protein
MAFQFGDHNVVDAIVWGANGLPPEVWPLIALTAGVPYRSGITFDGVYPDDTNAPFIDVSLRKAYFVDVGIDTASVDVGVTLIGKDSSGNLISGPEIIMKSSAINIPIAEGGDDLYHCPMFMGFAYGMSEMKIVLTSLSAGLATIRYGISD